MYGYGESYIPDAGVSWHWLQHPPMEFNIKVISAIYYYPDTSLSI